MNIDRLPKIIELRNALLCGLAVVVAVMLTNPFAEASFNDDFSYARTVQILNDTGKLTYNGWATASFIAQAYWGLLWVKAFGFSHTVLRLSTLPLAAGAISLCYLLGRQAGLQVRYAVFGALVVGLSPMFLPLAASFMTDAPGMFFTLLSMYLLIHAIGSPKTSIAVTLLLCGTIVGSIGGTSRQIVWVVPLVLLPWAAWLRRDKIGFLTAAILCWIGVFAAALFTMHWFVSQPYSIPELPLREQLRDVSGKPAHFMWKLLALGLTLLWMLLPAMWPFVRRWNNPRAVLSFLLLLGPVLVIAKIRPEFVKAPWLNNTLTKQGVMGGAELSSPRPIAVPGPIQILIGVIVLCLASVVIADVLIWLARPNRAFRKMVGCILHPQPDQLVISAMILFSAAYFALLLPRTASDQTYDRYILPLMPTAVLPLLLMYQRRGDRRIPAASWGLLALYALVAIIFTQDVIALDRARTEAADRMIAAGIPRTHIDAGFEFNYETQILAHGYINERRLKNPPGAYDRSKKNTPSVVAEYRIEYAPAPDTSPTQFGSVSYFSFLYPFHRRIFIDRFTNPTWLNPHAAGKSQMTPQPVSPDDVELH